MHGINNYLDVRFKEELSKRNISSDLHIYPLTMISFDFIVSSIFLFKTNQNEFRNLIFDYWDKVKNEQKKYDKLNKSGLDLRERINLQVNFKRSIEDVFDYKIAQWSNKNVTKKKLLEIVRLVLNKDLPS